MSKKLRESLKKTVASFVMIATIVSLSGVIALAPTVVSAAAVVIKDGDTVRNPNATGDAKYDVYIVKLVGTQKFKRLVLNPQVFNSYGQLSWSKIKTVDQATMDSFTTSAIVRVETNPKVYALAPNGDLGSKSWLNVSAATFEAAGGNWNSVYVINTTDAGNYTAAGDLTTQAQVSTFLTIGTLPEVSPTPTPTPTATPVPITGNVTVSVASDSPVATTLATGSAYDTFLKLNIANGTTGAVNVTSLAVTRGGISIDNTVSAVGLYGADGSRFGNVIQSLASAKATFNLSASPIAVAAGVTVPVYVKVNIAVGNTPGTMTFSVASASDVTVSAGTLAGSFPLMGATMTLVNGAATLGALTIDSVQLVADSAAGGADGTIVQTVNLGLTGYEVARFRFTAGANEDILIKSLRVYNNGSTADADLANVSLYGPDGVLLKNGGTPSGKYVTFDLSASPYTISKGATRDLGVRVDFVSGSTRTERFMVQNDYDVNAVGHDTNSGILVGLAAVQDTTFPVGDKSGGAVPGNQVWINMNTISAGTMSFNKSSASPSSDLPVGGTSITLGTWEVKAAGEDMELRQVDYRVNSTAANQAALLAGTIKLQMDDGTVIFSESATAIAGVGGQANVRNVSTYYTLPSGVTKKISLVVDLSTTTVTGTIATGQLRITQVRRVSSGDIVDPGDVITNANTLTVRSGALTISNNTSASPVTVVANSSVQAVLGSWNFTSAAAEGTNITSLQITTNNAGFGRNYKNLELWISGAKVSTDSSNTIAPSATTPTVTFTISPQKTIAAGQTVVVELRGMTLGATNDANTTQSIVANSVSGSLTVSLNSVANTPGANTASYLVTLAGAGALTVARDTVTNLRSTQLVAGQTGSTLAAFKLTSSNAEDIRVKKITLVATGTLVNGLGPNIGLYESGSSTPIGSVTVASLGSDSTFTFDYSSAPYTVPSNSYKVITVKADTTYTATAGGTLEFGISRLEAQGAASSAALFPTTLTGLSAAGGLGVPPVAGSLLTSLTAGDVVFASSGTAAGKSNGVGGNGFVAGAAETLAAAANSTLINAILNAGTLGATFQVTKMPARQFNGLNETEAVVNAAASVFPYNVGEVIAYTSTGAPANDNIMVVNPAGGVNVAPGTNITAANAVVNGLTFAATDRVSKISSGFSEAPSAAATIAYNAGDIVALSSTASPADNGLYVVKNNVGQGATMLGATAPTRMLTKRSAAFPLVADRVARMQTVSTELASAAAVNAYNVGDVIVVDVAGTPANNGSYVIKTAVAAGATMVAANFGGTGLTLAAADVVSKLYLGLANDNIVQIFPTNAKFSWTPVTATTAGPQVIVAQFSLGANAANASNPNSTVAVTNLAFVKSGQATLTNYTLYDVTNSANVATNASGPVFGVGAVNGNMATLTFQQGEVRTYQIKADVGTNGTGQTAYFTFNSGQFNSVAGNGTTLSSATWSVTNNSVTTVPPLWTALAGNVSYVDTSTSPVSVSAASDTTAPTISSILVTNVGVVRTVDAGDIITITFSKRIDPTSINAGLFYGATGAAAGAGTGPLVTSASNATGGLTGTAFNGAPANTFTVKNITTFVDAFSGGDLSALAAGTVQLGMNTYAQGGNVLNVVVSVTGGGGVGTANQVFAAGTQVAGVVKDTAGNALTGIAAPVATGSGGANSGF